MAKLLWGKVFYKDHFAGYLREEPGDRTSFAYDESYLNQNLPAIAHTLPLQIEPFFEHGLIHYFDNLVAEGWLEEAQIRLLGKRQITRFSLLLAFGFDCAGAVWVADPDPAPLSTYLDTKDPKEIAVMTGRASLSGIQPKLALIQREAKFFPVKQGELSTHIAKFPSQKHDDLVINEYLSTLAYKALLPEEDVVDLHIGHVEGFKEPILIIKRFDRKKGHRVHFEEFNQLLGLPSLAKYNAQYKDMAVFLRQTPHCIAAEVYRLFLRIMAGLLLGNTDMHLKNFAMFHTPQGLRLTPAYDTVNAALYKYNSLALSIGGARDIPIGNLKPSNLIKLGQEFGLSINSIKMAYEQLSKNKEAAIEAIYNAPFGSKIFKEQQIKWMKKRWNGTFDLIGTTLSSRR